jgi:cellulose synthase/poly-beta-1,6-N-acetylglucosamine synthase-like glycosyltransferase
LPHGRARLTAIDAILVVASFPALAASAYLLVLTALSGRPRPLPGSDAPWRFDVVIPAHDEEAGVAATVRSVLDVDYPEDQRRVIVVADNCSDATAERARAAGAIVLVRDDPRRGKGYALAHAFAWSSAAARADAVVVVDADTVVSRNLLRAFAARLDAGARAVQARYGVRNPEASWRTRLMAIAFALFHDVRSRGRERLRCSVGLRGNGMCFSTSLLREVPHDAFSIVEDLEYGLRLGTAGVRVQYADEASVLGDMVGGEAASRSQRRRWEGGRRQMARKQAIPTLARGLRRRDRVLVDLALDLLVPPISTLSSFVLAGLATCAAASWHAGSVRAAIWPWAASVVALGAHVTRGWWLSGTGLGGVAALLRAPAYVAWKIGLALKRSGSSSGAWVRTERPAAHGTHPTSGD